MISIEVRAILAALERVVALLLSIIGLGQALGIKLDKTAVEGTPYRIQGQVDWIGQQLTLSGTGLGAIAAKCDSIISALDGINAPVLDAIAALPAGSDIVIPDPAANATGVWSYVNGATPNPGTYSVGAQLAEAWGVLAEMYRFQVWRSVESPWFVVENPGGTIVALSTTYHPPRPDWTRLAEFTNIVDWLNGTDASAHEWEYDSVSGSAVTYTTFPGENIYAIRFLLLDVNLYPTRAVAAPVWPGLDNVTLGEPVALGADVTIPGPLDGVLIALTTPPSGLSSFSMGGQTWYYRAGQIAFVSDAGDVETWQYITWTNALYCPRQMYRASSAILRGLAGVEGTVTPWLTA